MNILIRHAYKKTKMFLFIFTLLNIPSLVSFGKSNTVSIESECVRALTPAAQIASSYEPHKGDDEFLSSTKAALAKRNIDANSKAWNLPPVHEGVTLLERNMRKPDFAFPGHIWVAIQAEADVNQLFSNGMLPIEYAMMNSRADNLIANLELLLEAGANVDQPFKNGMLPIYFAMMYNSDHDNSGHRHRILELFLKSGADPNAVSNYSWTKGKTMLDIAIEIRDSKAVSLLVKRGADLSQSVIARHFVGVLETNVHAFLDIGILKIFLEAGLDPNQRIYSDLTPIEYLMMLENGELPGKGKFVFVGPNDNDLNLDRDNHVVTKLKMLLEAGADPNAVSNYSWAKGKTMLDIATMLNYTGAANLLKEYGAKTSAEQLAAS